MSDRILLMENNKSFQLILFLTAKNLQLNI